MNEGFDKWKVYKCEAQSDDQHIESKDVNDVLWSTAAELVDHSVARDGVTAAKSKSV